MRIPTGHGCGKIPSRFSRSPSGDLSRGRVIDGAIRSVGIRFRYFVVLAALALAGCKKDDSVSIEPYKAAGVMQLDRLKKIGALIKAQPPLDADTATFELAHTSFKQDGDGAFVDAELLTSEGLQKDFYDTWITIEDHPFWSRCGAWFTTGKNPDGSPPKFKNVVDGEIARFLKVKTLAVVRTVELIVPEPTGDKEFSGGRWRFDVFFYTLDGAPRYLGGVRIDAVNDALVRVKFKKSSKNADMKDWLVHNLRHRTQAALYDAVTKVAPGITMDGPDMYKPD